MGVNQPCKTLMHNAHMLQSLVYAYFYMKLLAMLKKSNKHAIASEDINFLFNVS